MRPSLAMSAVAPAALLAAPALAQHAGDIVLTIGHDSGRIVTNSFVAGVVTPSRIFTSTLGVAFPDFTDSPGFDCLPQTFTPATPLGFHIRAALRVWNGADFSTIPDERLEIAFGPLGPVLTPESDSIVTGFTLPVGSNGQWHRHLEYTLGAPADAGVYLLQLDLFSASGAPLDAEPFWLLFNQNAADQERTASLAWAESHLLAPMCRADFNADGAANSQDFFDFLTAFFAADADFNADGVTNSQDYFDFIVAFFTGCE